MARIKPTITLRNERAGRNKRKRPQSVSQQAKRPFSQRVDWGRVRLWGVSLVFAALWILLWGRAYQVQIVRGADYAQRAKRAHVATELATGKRGSILDRNETVLARSVEAFSVAVRPDAVKNYDAAALVLSSTLNMPLSKAKTLVAGKSSFIWAARKISPRATEAIREANVPGIVLLREHERVYPLKHVAGQLLGFVDVDEKGIEGLELAFNDALSGQRMLRVMQRDAAGRKIYSGPDDLETSAQHLMGEDIQLTIDTQVQYIAESALAQGIDTFGARWAGCLVVEVASGDILAWAEYPFFNPNLARSAKPFERRNKTAMDAVEQGSTIKPFLMAAALQEKVIRPDSTFDCEKGKWKFRNVTIRDTSAHPVMSAKDIIKYSSNIGMAKIGLSLGTAKYYEYLNRLGFGVKTGLPLAGENKGILRPARQWSDVDLVSASFGQSFSATIAQMAKAYLCLANDGIKKDLRLVVSSPEEKEERKEPERIFSPEVMAQVQEMMRSVVEETGGTGRRARIDGLNIGGKTGTAQKASGDAYGTGRVASFVGMIPVKEPRYLVVVMLDEPVKNQYGGVVAAPIFKEIILRVMAYYGLLPDNSPGMALAEFARLKDLHGKMTAMSDLTEDDDADASPQSRLVSPAAGEKTTHSVPDVIGLEMRAAVEAFAKQGMVPEIRGNGNIVVRQAPDVGMRLPGKESVSGAGKIRCTIWLGDAS
ncbi:penicillin-binding protein [Deltaproteobacteria bacterium]|nr:penicillin-binding protein [Deltaproteobacteria bacterium]